MAVLSESLTIQIAGDTSGLNKATAQASKAIKEVGAQSQKTQKTVTASFSSMIDKADALKNRMVLVGGIFTLAATAIAAIALPILKVQDAMLEFDATLKLSGTATEDYSKRVKQFSDDMGVSYASAFDRVKKATSAFGGDVATALAVVESAMRAATLEVFTPTEAEQALGPVVRAYHVAASDVEGAMNLLQAAGANTHSSIGALSSGFVSVAKDALKSGVGLRELAETFLFLDGRGATAAESAELISGALNGALRPTEEQAAAAEKLGLNYTNMGAVGGRLGEIFQTLANHAEQNTEAVTAFLGGNVSLFDAFSGMGRGMAPFQESIDKLTASVNALPAAIAAAESRMDTFSKNAARSANTATTAWEKLWEVINRSSAKTAGQHLGGLLISPSGTKNDSLGANSGGLIGPDGALHMAGGGKIAGAGNTDTVPAMLTPGEFVVRKEVAEKITPLLAMLNGLPAGSLWQSPLQGTSIRGFPLLDLLGIPPPRFGIVSPNSVSIGMGAGESRLTVQKTVAAIMRAIGGLKLNSGGPVPGGGTTNNMGGLSISLPGVKSFDSGFVKRDLMPIINREMGRGYDRRKTLGA